VPTTNVRQKSIGEDVRKRYCSGFAEQQTARICTNLFGDFPHAVFYRFTVIQKSRRFINASTENPADPSLHYYA